jgi:hypothetical protein
VFCEDKSDLRLAPCQKNFNSLPQQHDDISQFFYKWGQHLIDCCIISIQFRILQITHTTSSRTSQRMRIEFLNNIFLKSLLLLLLLSFLLCWYEQFFSKFQLMCRFTKVDTTDWEPISNIWRVVVFWIIVFWTVGVGVVCRVCRPYNTYRQKVVECRPHRQLHRIYIGCMLPLKLVSMTSVIKVQKVRQGCVDVKWVSVCDCVIVCDSVW